MWNTTSEGCQFREKPCLFQEILCGSGSNSIHYICIALKKITFKQFFINFWSKIKPCIIVLDFALGLGSRTWILFLLPIQKIKSMLCVQCTRHRREIFTMVFHYLILSETLILGIFYAHDFDKLKHLWMWICVFVSLVAFASSRSSASENKKIQLFFSRCKNNQK